VTIFTVVSGAPACSIPINDNGSFISRPSQKFLCDNSGMLYLTLDCSISCSFNRTL